jgi:hypothetical protein
MRTELLVTGGLLALVTVGVLALVTGVGPAPGGEAGADVESFPTETPATPVDDSSGGDGGGSSSMSGGTATASETTAPPFGFRIDAIEPCGRTCRDVTLTLTNQQETTAEDVTVYTRIFVGQGTDGNVAWEGRASVGTLEAGASHTATRRVALSYGEAFAIRQHGGWVTVQTTVQTADGTVTFTEPRKVA